LWAWAVEQNTAHNTADSYELILPFMAEMHAARYPADAPPQTGAVNLTPVNEADGWLTDPDSYKTGLAVIAPYATYTKDKSVAGWLPNRRLAYIFRAFASCNKATPTATTYRWYFNGTAIGGATSNTRSLSSAQSGNAGDYTVVVSNVMGSVTSNQATLTVNPVPPPPAGGSGGGGGGGGSPSMWFSGALLLLAAVRKYQRRTREEGPANLLSE